MHCNQDVIGPRVLLTSTLRWPLAARLAMAFARMGCHVEVLAPQGHPARVSTAPQRIHRSSALRPLRALRRAIVDAAPDLILPCDDTAAVQLAQLHAGLSKTSSDDTGLRACLVRSLGNPAACALATRRAELLALAASEGVRVPATTVLATPQALAEWLMHNHLPAVLKSDASWGGHGVAIVYSAAQAQQAFARLSMRPSAFDALVSGLLHRDATAVAGAWRDARHAICVQAHVRGMPANRAVACWHGRVLAGVSVLALRTQHSTGPATVVQVVDHAEMALAAERIVGRLGLSGLWGLDFVIDCSTNAATLIEMNPRATPVCHLPLGAGRDLPAALCARWRGADPSHAVQPVPAIAGDRVALFPGEWRRDPDSVHLRDCHHDRPDAEPALVRECLLPPWDGCGLVARGWAAWRAVAPRRAAGVRQRTDPPAGRPVQTRSAPGLGTRLRAGVSAPRPRGATDASR